jgi:hypothetical protein
MKLTKRERIALARAALETMPCGGIGEDGPTIAELNETAERGWSWDDDAAYHAAQLAWRMLEGL